MATPNLNITHIAASQNQKEVTANAAFDALDAALCGQLSLDFTSGNVTLTDAQFRSSIAFRATNLSVARDLTVTGVKRLFFVNNANGTATLTVKRGAGAVAISAGTGKILYADGTTNGLFEAAGAASAASTSYLLVGSLMGKPSNAQRVFHHLAGAAFSLPQTLTGSAAKAKTAASAQADFDIQVNGVSKGTMRWAAAGTVASFLFASSVSVVAGDEIEIIAPGIADSTLADLAWTLKGTV